LAEKRVRDDVQVSVPYGDGEATCRIPRGNLGEILRPNPVEAKKEGERARIEQALAHPVGKPRLEEAVRREDSVALIVDDITRPTPVGKIVPEILKRLGASGITDDRVKIIVALGTHRPMTGEEIRERLGADIVSRIAVENHDFRDFEKLAEVGKSEEGIPIWINRSVVEASFRIGVGNIVPHGVAGWSGGGKIIYPGVAGERTVDGFHGAFGTNLENRVGKVDTPIRTEIDRLVRHVGLEYIVNTILTGEGVVYRAVAGDYVLAHRAGIAFAREVYSVRHESLADVAIVSSYPADIDFWQAGKAVYAGELLLRDGGTLILVTPCPERVAHNHDLLSYMAVPIDTLRLRMKNHDVDDRSAAAAAIRIGLIRNRVKIMVVSDGLTRTDDEGLGFHPAASLQEAVDRCLLAYGDGCRVSVLTHGGDLFPERAHDANGGMLGNE
jgi:lactate racemase